MTKQLCRSEQNKVFAGVCGGIGEYFDVDPVFVRIVTVILAFATGFGFLGYIVAWIIMPKREDSEMPAAEATGISPTAMPPEKKEYSSWNRYLPGLILVAIGVILLVRENWFWFDWEEFWPIALILVGLALIFRKRSKKLEDPLAQQAPLNGTVNNGESKPENGGSVA